MGMGMDTSHSKYSGTSFSYLACSNPYCRGSQTRVSQCPSLESPATAPLRGRAIAMVVMRSPDHAISKGKGGFFPNLP